MKILLASLLFFLIVIPVFAKQPPDSSRWVYVTTIAVDSHSLTGTDQALDKGQYKFVASGYWGSNIFTNAFVDVEYTTQDNWVTYTDGTATGSGAGPNLGDLIINNKFVNWGTYSTDHIYNLVYSLKTSGTVNFSVFDGDARPGGEKVPGWYDDNIGSLTIDIYRFSK